MKKATDEQIAASRGHAPSSMSKDPYGSSLEFGGGDCIGRTTIGQSCAYLRSQQDCPTLYTARASLEWKESHGPSFCSTPQAQIPNPDYRTEAAPYRAAAEVHRQP
jgi:hypothetical protein